MLDKIEKITNSWIVRREIEIIITAIVVYFAWREGDRRSDGNPDCPELIIGEKRCDWLQRHRRKSKRRRLAAREETGGSFKTECADRSTRMNLGPIPARRVSLLFFFLFSTLDGSLSDKTSFVSAFIGRWRSYVSSIRVVEKARSRLGKRGRSETRGTSACVGRIAVARSLTTDIRCLYVGDTCYENTHGGGSEIKLEGEKSASSKRLFYGPARFHDIRRNFSSQRPPTEPGENAPIR